MSKNDTSEQSEMCEEYDFSGGVRGKYAERFKQGSNVVVLDSDVAAKFPTRQSVNKALRVYLARRRSDEGAAEQGLEAATSQLSPIDPWWHPGGALGCLSAADQCWPVQPEP